MFVQRAQPGQFSTHPNDNNDNNNNNNNNNNNDDNNTNTNNNKNNNNNRLVGLFGHEFIIVLLLFYVSKKLYMYGKSFAFMSNL